MAQEKFFHLFNEGLKVVSYCPVCNVRYQSNRALVIDERDDAHLVYLKCQRCATSVLAVVLTNSLGVSSVGMVTDLSCDEVVKFRSAAAISADDVLEAHEALAEQDVASLVS